MRVSLPYIINVVSVSLFNSFKPGGEVLWCAKASVHSPRRRRGRREKERRGKESNEDARVVLTLLPL